MTIIKKFDLEQPERKLSKKLFFPVVFLVISLIVLEIWVNNTLITYGDKLQSISNLEKALKMDNQILENEVAKYTSLYNVATQSAKLGFSNSEKVEYIR